MTSRYISVLLILLGVACVVAAVWMLAGYAWAIGVVGVMAVVAGVLLYDPNPSKPKVWPNNRGVR
jgi:membrane-bound ClpP family serine protease